MFLTTGTQVQIHPPGASPTVGQLVGFYANEPYRAVVQLPSGKSLIVMADDILPAGE
jgi:hypothetical protein